MPPNASEIENDEFDERAVHFLATFSEKPVGTLRIIPGGDDGALPMEGLFDLADFGDRKIAEISRLMVLKEHRKSAVSFSLMKAGWLYGVINEFDDYLIAANPGTEEIAFSEEEKPPLLRMYEKIGFRAFANPKIYEKVNMPAVPMNLTLRATSKAFRELFLRPDANLVL
jgi:hypothetical protein